MDSSKSRAEAADAAPGTITLPAPTAWPIILAFGITLIIGVGLIVIRFVYCVAWLAISLPIERFVLHLEPHPIRAFRAWWCCGRHAYDAGPRHSHGGLKSCR